MRPEEDRSSEALADGRAPVRTIALNRPRRLNAVSMTLYLRLMEHLREATRDPRARVVILTGVGRAFCAGADLKAHATKPMDQETAQRYVGLAQDVNLFLQEMPLPVVAAVNGHAVGAGLELALSCDLIVVAEEAKLRLPELALGTFVGGGATYTLVDRVGATRAREILYLGEFFSGRDAARFGLANAAVPASRVLDHARALADRLLSISPRSFSLAKAMLDQGGKSPAERRHVMEQEARALHSLMQSDDWAEGLAAFQGQRRPGFAREGDMEAVGRGKQRGGSKKKR